MVQRDPIDIVDPNKKSSRWIPISNEYDRLIPDYQTIQKLLTSAAEFEPALKRLEQEVKAEKGKSPDPLDTVLLRYENANGINKALSEELQPGAPMYTATLSAEVFIKMSQFAVIPQDPGAYAAHGPYSHRIQWYVIFFYKDRLKTELPVLLQKMTSEEMKPRAEAWPKQQTMDGEAPVQEGSGTMWDALLDRQHADKKYVYAKDGITHPEMLTAALTGLRGASDANAALQAIAPTVAEIVTAAYDLVVTTGDKAPEHRARAEKQGYTAFVPDVYVRAK